MRITILYSENNPSDYHRLLQPAKYLKSDPSLNIRLVKHTDCINDESVFDCDILFFSRLTLFGAEKMQQLKKKYGFKIIVDFDDYHTLSPHQLRYKLWLEHNVAARMIEACRNADLVFVTNEQLYNVYKEFNKNVLIIPNAVPFNDQIVQKIDTGVQKLRFIYVAGPSHYHDLKLLKGLFDRLRSDGDFKMKASFTFCGYDGSDICKRMESICKINTPFLQSPGYERRCLLPLQNYMDHYCGADVAIAPLCDNLYNRYKSNLKFIEATSMKLPFICSHVLPYTQEVALKDKGIIFCNNTGDWYKAFKFFVNNPAAAEDFGRMNYEYVKSKYDLRKANSIRINYFEFLFDCI